MKVKMLKSYGVYHTVRDHSQYIKGKEYEVSEIVGELLLKEKVAEKCGEKKKEEEEKPAPKKRGRKSSKAKLEDKSL